MDTGGICTMPIPRYLDHYKAVVDKDQDLYGYGCRRK